MVQLDRKGEPGRRLESLSEHTARCEEGKDQFSLPEPASELGRDPAAPTS